MLKLRLAWSSITHCLSDLVNIKHHFSRLAALPGLAFFFLGGCLAFAITQVTLFPGLWDVEKAQPLLSNFLLLFAKSDFHTILKCSNQIYQRGLLNSLVFNWELRNCHKTLLHYKRIHYFMFFNSLSQLFYNPHSLNWALKKKKKKQWLFFSRDINGLCLTLCHLPSHVASTPQSFRSHTSTGWFFFFNLITSVLYFSLLP